MPRPPRQKDPNLIALGRVIQWALDACGWEQKDLAAALDRAGVSTNKDQISDLINANRNSVPAKLVQGIARLGICKDKTGRAYTTDDLLDIAFGRIQVQPPSVPELILAEMKALGMDRAQFAEYVKLPEIKLKVLLGEATGIIEPTDITFLCVRVATPMGETGDWQWWADAIGVGTKKGAESAEQTSSIEKPNGSNGAATQGANHPR